MAGLGRKDFQAGAVLSAADVDGYLMDQSVMKFASDAARSSAIGTAVSAGMTSYRTDAKTIEVYDGSSWNTLGAPDVAGKNKIINGGFDYWFRGNSGTVTSALYSADRWICDPGSMNATWSQQAFTPGAAPVAGYEAPYFYRYTVNSGSGGFPKIQQRIEDVRTFAGQTVTLSFYAKASVGKSEAQILLIQNFGSGGSSSVFTNTSNYNSTTSWQRYTFTVTLPSIAGKTIGAGNHLDLEIQMIGSGTYSYDIWGVQLEAGSVATPFQRAAGTIAGELAACQRYTQVFDGPQNFSVIPSGFLAASTSAEATFTMPVQMRVAPTSIIATNMQFYNIANAGAYSGGTWTLGNGTKNIAAIRYTHGSSMGSLGNPGVFTPNSTTGGILLSAEL